MSTRYFLDTSALVKLYHDEAGTDVLDERVIATDSAIVISELSKIELLSALARRVRMGEIREAQLGEAIVLFESDLPSFEIIRLSEDVVSKAFELVKSQAVKAGLRTLDSLQLSAALQAAKSSEIIFVVSDKKLSEAAEGQSLEIWPVAI
jgi:predicted nucleic acid-binding protein